MDEDPLLHASGRQVALDLKKGPCFSPAIIPYSAHDVCYKVLYIYTENETN